MTGPNEKKKKKKGKPIYVSPVGVYPVLRKFKINFSPVRRIFAGFLLVSVSMVYSSVLQHYIYMSPAKNIHVWIQAPAYILVAFSEAFVIVTGLELAFTHAPKK
jgi:POT family proton-dependent oligopeptide transporter